MEPVEVSFHPDTYDTYFKPLEATNPGFLSGLLADFCRYQQSMRDDLPDYFGFDAEYGSPKEISGCLEHIHLCIPPRKFPEKLKQGQRKCKVGDPTNDVALVYARGRIEFHKFCIIGILMPDAHAQANNNDLMLYLGRLGREFQYAN